MNRRWLLLRLMVIFLVMAGTVWAALRLCPACGREAAAEDTVCGHCGHALPPAESAEPVPAMPEAEPPPAAEPAAAPAADIPDALIDEQVRTARGYAEREAWWGAILFARNAQALLGLRDADGARRQAEMAIFIAQARAHLTASSVECPACEGSGKQKMITLSLGGESNTLEVAGGRCPACHGLGRLPSLITADEWARQEGEALRVFKLEQLKRGLEEFRGIWLPHGTSANLSVRQIAALRRGFGTPCETCHGIGSAACSACEGAGRVVCPKTCTQGWLVCPDCGGKGRSNKKASESGSSTSGSSSGAVMARCDTCKGAGKLRCTECDGTGVTACETCSGSGRKVCAICKGRGEAPSCAKCQGAGLTECPRCKGTGTYRDKPCEDCNGGGVKLCTACQGAGAVSRAR